MSIKKSTFGKEGEGLFPGKFNTVVKSIGSGI